MIPSRAEQNFSPCELGDRRLNRRALSIGVALSEHFGQALSTVFETAKELKRAYAFSPMSRRALSRSLHPIAR